MSGLCERIEQLRGRIARAERKYGRSAGAVTLLAVSKTQSVMRITEAAGCGQLLFAESYLQEAERKIEALAHLDLQWHYVGPIQANKTRPIARRFAWVHSVDRLKVARRLHEHRPPDLPPLEVCLQVNISRESQKAGVMPEALPALAEQVAGFARLRLRGLMAIPAPTPEVAAQRRSFAAVRKALEELDRRGHALDTLSMGMTANIEAAIAEGATIVRIGTGIFGPRRAVSGE
jgi:pyridoxal phosphate enzyme (YggS family)